MKVCSSYENIVTLVKLPFFCELKICSCRDKIVLIILVRTYVYIIIIEFLGETRVIRIITIIIIIRAGTSLVNNWFSFS